ncbi:MAG: cytochrome b/b6 domain-containing protein, partial [Alphaproteobacteria bacterium]|nr:cytochrome b/b6 domain-containing protein [Alphaproteobacteria bacterium]
MKQTTAPRAISRYDAVAMSLHWLIALAVIGNFALGLYHADLPDEDPMARVTIFLHISIGLTILALSVIRVGWRLTHKIPALPVDMPRLQKVLARIVEGLLYVLIIAVPLVGWMMVSATTNPHPIPFFGLFDWPHIGAMVPLAEQYGRP